MPKFTVTLNAQAIVTGSLEVTADSPEDAEDEALKRLGEIVWRYAGLTEDEPITESIEDTSTSH